MPRCVDCDCVFGNNGALGIHRKFKHRRGYQSVQEANCEMCVCPDCGNAFEGIGGLNVHRRISHPDVYHAARRPAARVKARWSHEEMVLVARAELEIRGAEPPGGILRVLQSRFPDRTLEAIKCLRNKNRRYMEVLAAHEAEEQTPDQELPDADSREHSNVSSEAECSWRDHLRMAINIAYLGVDGLDWVTDGYPDQAVRDRLVYVVGRASCRA